MGIHSPFSWKLLFPGIEKDVFSWNAISWDVFTWKSPKVAFTWNYFFLEF
jgi:hypothetical protein